MRFIFSGLLALAMSFPVAAQEVIRCYTTEMQQQMREQGLLQETDEQFERWLAERLQGHQLPESGDLVIPVVVHIIYQQPSNPWNISDAQVISQIDVLNEDFLRLNPDTTNTPTVFQSVAVNTGISFCLAQRDPQGNPTTGIIRHQFTQASSWSSTTMNNTIKPATIWDPTRYMNVWVANLSGGLLGYAQFPTGSGLPGLSGGNNANTDGIVVLYSSVGRPPFNPFNNVYNLGRTATHEVGHYLGLRHIWGDGNCSADDFCDDTPRASSSNFGCPTRNSCNDINFPPFPAVDLPDQVENYMDYSNDACMNLFTANQRDRMVTVLMNSPRRASLVTANSCLAAIIRPQANFAQSADTICSGASVSFTDLSANSPVQWLWQFPGGVPATDTTANPTNIRYDSVGVYSITLVATNQAGSDTISRQLVVSGNGHLSLDSMPLICGFDSTFALRFGQPRGGVYQGAGVSNDSLFNPAVAGAGLHWISYTLPGCGLADSLQLQVVAVPQPLFQTSMNSFCLNDAPLVLQASPAGGSFSGPGVQQGSFDPRAAGLGTHRLVYSLANAQGCVAIDTLLVEVNALPATSISLFPPVCVDRGFVRLTGGLPAGGNWSGSGVSNDTLYFNSAGQKRVYYTSPPTANGCTNTDSTFIDVNNPPALSFAPVDPICIRTSSVLLNMASLPGGNYTGNGVNFGVFFPMQAGVGTHTIYYSTSRDGCTLTDSFELEVFAAPDAVIEALGSDSLRSREQADQYRWFFNGQWQQAYTGRSIRPLLSGSWKLQLEQAQCLSEPSADYVYFVSAVSRLESWGIRIYPNPSSGLFYLNRQEELAEAHIQIRDLQGRLVREFRVLEPMLEIDLRALAAGTYLLQYEQEGQRAYFRLVRE
ncbi:MAG: M43 family zinc metalloprotease [Bacteroidia bacterium]